jgi:hypothetical protein
VFAGEEGYRIRRCFGWWKEWAGAKVARETKGRNFLVERLMRVLTGRFKGWSRHARGVAASGRYAEIRRLGPRFRVWGLRVWGLGFGVWGLAASGRYAEIRRLGPRFRVWGFRVWGLGFGG